MLAASAVIAFICAVAVFAGLGGPPGQPAIFCPHGCTPESLDVAKTSALRHMSAAQVGPQQMHLDFANLVQTVALGTVVAVTVTGLDLAARRRRRTSRMTRK